MSKQMNIPQLRFPEFKGIWQKKALLEVAEKITDGTHDTPKPVENGIPYLTAIHIKDGFVDYENCYFVTKEVHNVIYKRCNPEKDDLLIVNIGAGTATCALNTVDYEFSMKNVALVKPNKNIISGKYLAQFQRTKSEKIFNQLTSGGAQPFLSLKEIGKLEISLPSLKEQTKIATFLSEVDQKIQALKKKHSLLEQYKKGVMQKLFSQEMRFKDENGNDFPEWEVKKLGEVAKITTGSSNRQDSNLDGKYTFFDRSIDIRTSDRFLFDAEAIIVPGEGQEFIPKYFIGKFDLHQRTYAIMDFKNANGLFLYYSISFNTNHLNSQAVGSTVKSLRLPMFETMPINLPSLPEQTAIANFLSALDEKINQTQRQIEKTEVWKKGLLQKMFV